jgi:type I restriction enzyme S subunit
MKWLPYPAYKDADVAWLTSIPEHWNVRRLKHIASTTFSNVDKHTVEGEQSVRLCNYVDVYYNDYITPGLEFMVATASRDEIAKFSLREADVIITKDSESWDDIAVAAYVPSDLEGVLCGYHLAMIRPAVKMIDGKYLFRAFSARGINDQFRVAATGITRYGLGKHWLDNSYFPLPPLDEQCAIAAFLDRETAKIDTLIAKQERLIELLHEKRVALIRHVVTKGFDPTVPMKDSGIPAVGQIPAHWQVNRNKWIYRELNHRSTTGDEELLSVSHITGVTPRSEKEVYMFMAESMEGYKLCSPGDLVINTMWAWMGALGVSEYEGIVSPSYHVYTLRNEQAAGYVPKYLDLLYRTPVYVCEITRHSKGIWSSRLRLYPDAFFDMQTITPPLPEQHRIIDYISEHLRGLDALVQKCQQLIGQLQEYRTALISAAVIGKIDVRGEQAYHTPDVHPVSSEATL